MQLPYEEEVQCLGRPFYPPFRWIDEDISVVETYPSYFLVVAHFIEPALIIDDDIPHETQLKLLAGASHGFTMFLQQESTLGHLLPRATEKAKAVSAIVDTFITKVVRKSEDGPHFVALRKGIDGFFISLRDEMDRLPTFTVTDKGNLAVRLLVNGASKQYPKGVLELVDSFITGEVDHAGRCLAFELPTACGFHILRAVEISAKAYVHAATGALPGIKNRNWGEYISQLTQVGAHSDVIDLLKILKTRRNPLMHPQDSLDMDEAIGLICICQSAIETLVEDVKRRKLEIKFKESLALLPTL